MLAYLFLPTNIATATFLKSSRWYVLRECKLILNIIDILLFGVPLHSFGYTIGQILSWDKISFYVWGLKSSILVKIRGAEKKVIYPHKSDLASPWTLAWNNPFICLPILLTEELTSLQIPFQMPSPPPQCLFWPFDDLILHPPLWFYSNLNS